MSTRTLWIIAAVILLAAIAVGTATSFLGGETIHQGVRVAGEDLGGLTIQQAETQLAPRAGELAGVSVTLKYAGESLTATVAGMGGVTNVRACALAAYRVGRDGNVFRRIADVISARRRGIEVPAIYSLDQEAASEYLQLAARKVNRQPVNAKLVVEGTSVRPIPEKPGIELDTEESLERVVRAINSGEREVELAVAASAPKLTMADIEGIDGVVSSYSTPYKAWQRDRTSNLKIACRSINGTLIKPGETFSYNKVVGPRLKKYGFREAPIFIQGEVELGIGGGVCQVSTTVYNAALLANMKILSRTHHSRPVVYAPIGRDATVAYPTPDLKFQNTSTVPIYILASVGKRDVNISFLGRRDDNRKVEIFTAGHKVIEMAVVEKIDESLEPGGHVVENEGRDGHRVSVYRVVKLGGKVAKRELISKDYYRPDDRVIAVPPPPEPSSTPEPEVPREGIDNAT